MRKFCFFLRRIFPLLCPLLIITLMLSGSIHPRVAQAALLNVSLSNTSQLPANTGFFIQYFNVNNLADGNRVLINNLVGLTPVGPPDYRGDASGDLSGAPSGPAVGDAGNNLSNEFFQGFTATATPLSFDVNTLNSVGNSTSSDVFSLQLFRQDNNPFVTNAPDNQSLFTITFDSQSNPTINGGLGNFSTNDPSLAGGQITATVTTAAVPEPSTWAMMALGIGALGLITRRKRSATQNSNDLVGIAV